MVDPNLFVPGGPDATIDDRALVVTGSIACLGKEDVTVQVDATAIVQCENLGGNTPPGQAETMSGAQTITDPKNGRAIGLPGRDQ